MIGDKKTKKIFNSFQNWCSLNNKSQLSSCLNFVKQINQIDSIVVGFDNNDELEEIITQFKKNTFKVPLKFRVNQKQIIDPRKW